MTLRTATAADLAAAASTLDLPPVALAPALEDPRALVLVSDGGRAALLRREWAAWSTAGSGAEAVVLRDSGVELDDPAVLAVAAGWGCASVRRDADRHAVPRPDGTLEERFVHLALLAATDVEAAVAAARGAGEDEQKADGSWSLAADEAAHAAATAVMDELGVAVLSEERDDRRVEPDAPWVVLDPLDGTGNFRAGLPPWAFSAALVVDGRAVAGVVVDLAAGRRWWGLPAGAWRDGRSIRTRSRTTIVLPTPPSGAVAVVPPTARRIRITGCTAIDVCLVADGSAGAWHDLDRNGTHVHDVAGALGVLAGAGGVALTPTGEPLRLEPDTETLIKFVAASSEEAARELLG
jgi:3'(2'), 5'-bisphosphate nucleotidase